MILQGLGSAALQEAMPVTAIVRRQPPRWQQGSLAWVAIRGVSVGPYGRQAALNIMPGADLAREAAA